MADNVLLDYLLNNISGTAALAFFGWLWITGRIVSKQELERTIKFFTEENMRERERTDGWRNLAIANVQGWQQAVDVTKKVIGA